MLAEVPPPEEEVGLAVDDVALLPMLLLRCFDLEAAREAAATAAEEAEEDEFVGTGEAKLPNPIINPPPPVLLHCSTEWMRIGPVLGRGC